MLLLVLKFSMISFGIPGLCPHFSRNFNSTLTQQSPYSHSDVALVNSCLYSLCTDSTMASFPPEPSSDNATMETSSSESSPPDGPWALRKSPLRSRPGRAHRCVDREKSGRGNFCSGIVRRWFERRRNRGRVNTNSSSPARRQSGKREAVD